MMAFFIFEAIRSLFERALDEGIHEDFHSFCEALDRDSDRTVDAPISRFEDLIRTEASAPEASLADARSAAEVRDARTITIIEELREDSRANAERHAALLSAQTAVLEKLSTPTPSFNSFIERM